MIQFLEKPFESIYSHFAFDLHFSQNAMQIVGFMEDEVQSVLELVAAVLKLGNIEFKPESRCNGGDESRIKDKNGPCWKAVCLNNSLIALTGRRLISPTDKRSLSLFFLFILTFIFYFSWYVLHSNSAVTVSRHAL